MKTSVTTNAPLHGNVAPGFEAVQTAFARNFTERGELGGACTIYYRGEKVVDLWGGYRNPHKTLPWQEDTMVIVFSSTKGLAGLAMALAHSRGLFEYDAPIASYWPDFAQNGKEHITVRQLLAHEAGLSSINEPLPPDVLANPDALATILARATPAWEPGTHHGYHAFTLGWYESEIIRRTDPQHRTLGRFFHDELARPLGLEFYIGLPQDVDVERIATITEPPFLQKLLGMPRGMMLGALIPGSQTLRMVMPGIRSNLVFNTPTYWSVEIPSAGGIGQASSIARAYSVFATGGLELGIKAETLSELQAPAQPPVPGGWRDVNLHMDMAWALGFLKPFPGYHFGSSDAAYGAPGSGGSFGFADPAAQVGYAYVTNKQWAGMLDDPREKALRDAFYRIIM